MNEYISYGFSKFDRQRFENEIDNAILNERIDKPANGWWGSSIDANYGWKEWCYSEDFGDCANGTYKVDYIKWKLKDAKIYHIQNFEDLAKIPVRKVSNYSPYLRIDFDKMKSQGYDGIELCLDDYYLGHTFASVDYILENEPNLTKEQAKQAMEIEELINTWDCDSICVWNSKVIDVIEEKEFDDVKIEYEEGLENGKIEKEIEKFFEENFKNVKNDDYSYWLSFDKYYTIDLENNSFKKNNYDIFVNRNLKEVKEYYMASVKNYKIFKEIQDKALKIQAYLDVRENIIDKAKLSTMNLSVEKRIKFFEETLPEELTRNLYPAKFSKMDYIELLKRHGIELTEKLKQEEEKMMEEELEF